MKINTRNILHLATSIIRGSTSDHIEDKSIILKVNNNTPLTWNNGTIYLDDNLIYDIIYSHSGSKVTYTIPINVAPWSSGSLAIPDQYVVFFVMPNNRSISYTLIASDLKVDTIANLNTNYKLSTTNKNIVFLFYRDGEYLHNLVTKTVHKKDSTVILNALSEPSGFQYGVDREGDGGGTGGSYGLDLDNVGYLISSSDMFGHTDRVDLTNTTATYNVKKEAFDISYDSTRTATTSGTTLNLSAAPNFTIQIGDIIWTTISGNQEVRKITALGNINIDGTGATIDSAFAPNLSGSTCTVSQLVSTKDLMHYYLSGNEESISNANIIGHIYLSGISGGPLDIVTYSEQPDWKDHTLYQVGDYILKENSGTIYETTINTVSPTPGQLILTDTTNFGSDGNAMVLFKDQLEDCIINYFDDGSFSDVNIACQAITGNNLDSIWKYQYGYSRDINLGNSIQQININSNAVGAHFYARFYSNKTTGSGSVRLYEYQAAFYHERLDNGPNVQQAYGITNASAMHKCTITVVSGKTRITPVFNYMYNQNPGEPFGFLIVQLDGYEIPRYVSPTLTPGPYYIEDVNGSYIDLDQNYSASSLDVAVLIRIGAPQQIDITVPSGISSAFSEAIVGNATDVSTGRATHSTYASAIAAVISGSKIYCLETAPLENVVLDRKIYLEGKGNQVVIGDLTFNAGSSSSLVKNLKINGNVLINVAADNVVITDCWQNSVGTFTDNSANSMYIILPQ